MNPFKLIGRVVRWLWQVSALIRYPFESGLRTGSRVAGLYMFLVLLFLLIGIVLMVLGFDLGDVDRWLGANGGWIEGLASLALKVFWGLIFLFSLAASAVLLFELGRTILGPRGPDLDQPDSPAMIREEPAEEADNPGPGGMGCGIMVALIAAYFSWFGMIG
jgi:hypothetical protein